MQIYIKINTEFVSNIKFNTIRKGSNKVKNKINLAEQK